MSLFGELAWTAAVQKAFRPPRAKSAGAQMLYLSHSSRAPSGCSVASDLQRTVRRYVKGQIKKPRRTSPPGWNAK
ncbi:hypothetical protein GCM10017687_29480 [Streptomyces echinatus]